MTLPDISRPDISQLWQLAEKGGPIMLVLLALSVAALAVAILKAAQFIVMGTGRDHKPVRLAIAKWRAGEHDQALAQITDDTHVVSELSVVAMTANSGQRPVALVREEIETRALAHLASLRSHLRVLEATSQLAPLIGLFGTVIGMMSAFEALQSAGTAADPSALAGGIWTALITTAVGLAVAIPASFILYWFEGRISREQTIIETTITAILTAPATLQQSVDARTATSFGLSDAAE
jgi:biopolymer transport protein ExbB